MKEALIAAIKASIKKKNICPAKCSFVTKKKTPK